MSKKYGSAIAYAKKAQLIDRNSAKAYFIEAKVGLTCIYNVSKNTHHFYFMTYSFKHWSILIILTHNIRKKLDVSDCSFAHLTLILMLHYLLKCRSRSLVVYTNEFILGSACFGSENH